jgi:hypothetical protein
VVAWFSRIDEGLVPELEQLLGFAAGIVVPPPVVEAPKRSTRGKSTQGGKATKAKVKRKAVRR